MGRRNDNGDFVHEPHEGLMERHVHTLHRKCNTQRRVVMDEICDIRATNQKHFMKTLTRRIGPKWYQIFSTKQRSAVDFTKNDIFRTLLTGKPDYVYQNLKQIGIYRIPNRNYLMSCVYMARDDPKELFAQLFHYTYGQTFDFRVSDYDLNGKLLLTSIYYLGLLDLTRRLEERFSPDTRESSPPRKPKAKRDLKPTSPYLERCVASLWRTPKRKRFVPTPLPDLESLNDSFAPTPVPTVVQVPPAPARRVKSFAACDKMLGVRCSSPEPSVAPASKASKIKKRNIPRMINQYNKRNTAALPPAKNLCKGKLVAPRCNLENKEFHISGIFCVKGKYVYGLSGVIQIPLQGEIIHGGYRRMKDGCVNIIQGIRGIGLPPELAPCDCVYKYGKIAFDHLQASKCSCGHDYDFGHKGTFPADEIPYFTKPTKASPMEFNYDAIYELNPTKILINKQFYNLWKKDSMLITEKKKEPIKKKMRDGQKCLGHKPKDIDYLRCALGHLRRVNMAARLPDLHKASELKEWMRNRLHGPLKPKQRARIIEKSKCQSDIFHNLLRQQKWGLVLPDKSHAFSNVSDWGQCRRLRKDFAVFAEKYRKKLYLRNANIMNLLWTVMYQGELPSLKFRDTYFSYMVDLLRDFQIMKPYNAIDSLMRARFIDTNRMLCVPREVLVYKEGF